MFLGLIEVQSARRKLHAGNMCYFSSFGRHTFVPVYMYMQEFGYKIINILFGACQNEGEHCGQDN